uniref:Splicing factor, arginine/serine-rich 7 n=1 Tax=Tetraselmis sp. GSL018 TaxID=582737 RepID=A0A061RFE5_9CHLO|mmetsp:Transcript_19449/g.46408  ORF Transcript_19449/g.46408 Transcript_19449/m.46408 type:complete len:173 (+) Transcript_19449:160-678(+)
MASTRVYVGNLDPRVTEQELEDQFTRFGTLRSVWVARKPPGFAFLDYNDPRDAEDAVREINGKYGWRVEFSRADRGRGGFGGGRGFGPPGGGGERRCYECNEVGHLARDCRLRQGGPPGGRSPPRYRSPPPRRSRSVDRGRRSPYRRSASPRGRSRDRSYSPARSRSRSYDR